MASLQAPSDVVTSAVSSITTCTPATVVTLKGLLLVETETAEAASKSTARPTKTAATAKPRGNTTKKATARSDEQLSARDRTVLATHIINAALKALTEAAKPPTPSTPCKPSDGPPQPATRRALRRSASQPMSPLQPRSLNRVATSPIITTTVKAKTSTAAQSTGCLAVVECARAAFACLRALKPSTRDPNYDFQLENGMSAFIGKLLALNMNEQALKELRILKRRLEPSVSADVNKSSKPAANSEASSSVASVVAGLLEFKETLTKETLPIAVSLQIQVLKLVNATKKPSHIDALLPVLLDNNPSCPASLLSKSADGGDKATQKAARQMASICQILLSISPSVSSHEDTVATEPRLSPSPLTAFQLQCIAFKMQLTWWQLAGHKGNVDDEVLAPFSRCVRALSRRQKSDDKKVFQTIESSFNDLTRIIRSHKLQPSESSKSPLSTIYQLLGSTAHAARQYDGACRWFQNVKESLDSSSDSAVRICSVSARILASALKMSKLNGDIDQHIREVSDGLEGGLSGTVNELNELLESLSAARRSVVGLLMKELDPKSTVEGVLSKDTSSLLKQFTLRYPRFARRWMGTPPAKDAPAKQILQFDQRKQLVLQSINQTLDATLMVVKCEIQSGRIEWQQMDDVLQHCAGLLDSVSDATLSPTRLEQFGSYHVKISTLYFSRYAELRKMTTRSKDVNKQLLQSLSRSIDAVKTRSAADKDKAQLAMKLELFADLCKSAGRADDAVGTLRSICTDMAEDGVLSNVAIALSSQPPAVAWTTTEKASVLSRTLRSIAKLDRSWNDWTFFMPESERAAVLEHLMHLCADPTTSVPKPLRLNDPSPAALLRIYTVEKYPIRRFRVLLHLLYQNIGEEDEATQIISSLEQALQHIQKQDKGEDGSLSSYIPHLQIYYSSLSVLADSGNPLPTTLMQDNISCWKIMVESSQSQSDLYAKIDNPEALARFLNAFSNLAGLRGESQLQVAISELSICLSKVYTDCASSASDGLISSHSHLARQYVSIGKFTQASTTLEISQELLQHNEGISRQVVADFYLSQAEYHAGIGGWQDALSCIDKANDICGDSHSSWAQSKSQANVMMSVSALIKSTISLQTGKLENALSTIKSAVRMLSHEWSKLESSITATSSNHDASISETSIEMKSFKARTDGPLFWGIAPPLLRCLLHMSSVYAHIGMFQETIYYAESAAKIADSTNSSLYRAQVAAWTGAVYLKAGNLSKALHSVEDIKDQMPSGICSARVQFARQLGEIYYEIGEGEMADEYLSIAEETLKILGKDETKPQETNTVTKAKPAPVKGARAGRAGKPKTPAATRTTKRAAPSKAKTTPAPDASSLPNDVYQSSLLAGVILSRAVGFIQEKDWTSALSTLEKAKELPKLFGALSLEQMVTATSLIGHSMEQMISDPVFSVMQDSTISFPAVSIGSEKATLDKPSPMASPPRRARGSAGDKKLVKEKGVPVFADALRRAQEVLVEAHASALSSSDSGTVRRISTLLQNTIILLSATSASKAKPTITAGLATVAVDLGRNITWTRERNTLSITSGATGSEEAHGLSTSRRVSNMGLATDMSKFHKNYVDLLPKTWSVISLSVSDNCHDLCITKLQAGHSPFILRLPLERANSRDADSEVFNFEHGREELLEIIGLANETSHSARDFSAKGERSAWWSEREALDLRLKDLLTTVETTWLGGFKGIFSQHLRRPDLLARFQKSFQQILDGSLPSRNRMRGKKTPKTQNVNLDPRILDLFIGLGDPTEPDCDYDEALNDLLYFVVDILQFHGERNAYDEIDFDAMVVETYDALRGYYSAAKSGSSREEGSHTILVLDKALHAFPWESLPCMEGLAVSRVPSLACLRQLITDANIPRSSSASCVPEGHHVSKNAGTYILNPSADLKNTQSFFQNSFKTLKTWNSIVNKAPQESEFEEALSKSEVLLYFGHGSGAQYIRGKTVRRLEKCKPATFLMGCSSAALSEAGEFECYGPVWNYMMAGCPAVVGTLWDVTDRDIDRFAGRAFEEWGLFARGTFKDEDKKKAKGKGRSIRVENDADIDDDCDGSTMSAPAGPSSLPEAVARARNACKFRYLNAAAVVVYGIPVYVTQE